MKKIVFFLFFLVAVFSSVAAWAGERMDLRSYSTGRLGIIRAGTDLSPDWIVDVWVNPVGSPGQKPRHIPSFALPFGGSYEWEADRYGLLRIYAEAWVWDRGQRVVVAPFRGVITVQVGPSRTRWSEGFGWEVVFSRQSFSAGYGRNSFFPPP